jgi:hypothetical protein
MDPGDDSKDFGENRTIRQANETSRFQGGSPFLLQDALKGKETAPRNLDSLMEDADFDLNSFKGKCNIVHLEMRMLNKKSTTGF